ncbi:hypothetical protein VTK56DRAFT_1299 [Thermocarpiscus australiensis]
MTIVAIAIPKITDEFHGLDKVSWYSATLFMTNGGFQSSWGKAYRYFPLKMTFVLSIAVFELGSLICAVAPNSTTFIIGRAINGLGAAGIGRGGYTIIAFVAEPHKRPCSRDSSACRSVLLALSGRSSAARSPTRSRGVGVFGSTSPLEGSLPSIILFFFHTPGAVNPVLATWREKELQMDPVGVALVMGAIVSFMLSLQYGRPVHHGTAAS